MLCEGVCVCVGGDYMFVCVAQPSLPPPSCVAPVGVCVLFVLSTVVRGVLLSLSATTAAAAAVTASAWDRGGCLCPEHGLGSAGTQGLMLGLGKKKKTQTKQKKLCTYEAGAQLWQSDLAGGASQRVGGGETGMCVGGFCHAQFEP